MALTPLDIHNKEFSRGFRGYDEDEVNEFLDQVIQDYEMNAKQKADFEAKIAELEQRLQRFVDIEETLNKALLLAQNAGEEVKRNAKQEAKLIILEAKKNADRIVNEALAKSGKINLEMEDLKKQAKLFKSKIKMLIQAQLEMLGSSDWDKIENYDINSDQTKQ